jgi:hypothetical protein
MPVFIKARPGEPVREGDATVYVPRCAPLESGIMAANYGAVSDSGNTAQSAIEDRRFLYPRYYEIVGGSG